VRVYVLLDELSLKGRETMVPFDLRGLSSFTTVWLQVDIRFVMSVEVEIIKRFFYAQGGPERIRSVAAVP